MRLQIKYYVQLKTRVQPLCRAANGGH